MRRAYGKKALGHIYVYREAAAGEAFGPVRCDQCDWISVIRGTNRSEQRSNG